MRCVTQLELTASILQWPLTSLIRPRRPPNLQGGNVTLSISGGHCVFNKDKTGGYVAAPLLGIPPPHTCFRYSQLA